RAYTLERAGDADAVMREAFAQPDAALVEAVIDPNEPPMPGHIETSQALNFAKALARGDQNRAAIIKSVLGDKVREVI
ncbi:MAG TPA: pyruvate oxidase, partial [Polyangia bacterium]|nr:pyruvate oxidase [Polyangia bacterium]